MPRGQLANQRPAWLSELRAGDVIRTPSNDFRLVRRVTVRPSGNNALVFAIRRCSWTRRPYTVAFCSANWLWKCQPVGKLKGKLTALDFVLQRDIEDRSDPRRLHCCDVRGLP